MIPGRPHCPECGAAWPEDDACRSHFHQMLAWETEYPDLQAVHHLMVLAYHLQHPSLYSPEGVTYGIGLLREFVEEGVAPPEARRRHRGEVDSGKRKWRVTARPGAQGAYARPVTWTLTAADVVAGGPGQYRVLVERWARSILDTLRATGNCECD